MKRQKGDEAPKPTASPTPKRRVVGGKARARSGYFERQRTTAHRAADLITPIQVAQDFRAHARASASQAQIWRPLGPFCIPHGQTYGHGLGSRPSISGRISAIAVDPADPKHLLIGSGAGGGVWESRDDGETWSPRTDDQPSLFIGAVAFDPNDPRVVYAGTGEGDSLLKLGVGLLQSTNGGRTWRLLAGTPFEGAGFFDLVVDPTDSRHILAATTAGLFLSVDGGMQWRAVRSRTTWNLSLWVVLGNGRTQMEILAACEDGVYRSTNGGAAWRRVELPNEPTEWERIEVRHAPSDGNIAYVFAAGPPRVPDPIDPKHKGAMPKPYLWERRLHRKPFASIRPPSDVQSAQAWYDWCAAVAPNNPDVLYLGAVNLHKGVRSGVGGWTWENISARKTGDSIHPDVHALAFGARDPNVVYVGNDGGVFRSPDGGSSWASLNKGLCISEVEFMALHPRFETWMLVGTQDNGTLRYQGEEVWQHVADGDGGDCAANGSAPFTCYHTFYGIGLRRSRVGGGWNTWDDRTKHMRVEPEDDYSQGALFYAPLEARNHVVAQAGRSAFLSENYGTHWGKIALPENTGRASALALPRTTHVVIGTEFGDLIEIRRGPRRWRRPRWLGRPVEGFVSDVLVDVAHGDRIWATYSHLADAGQSGKIVRSDDGGATWVDVTHGLPPISLNAVEVDPQDSGVVYVAADVGVWRSADAGKTWTNFSRGLPNALVKDLVFHPEARVLRAGTQARGVWEVSVDDVGTPSVDVYARDSAVDTGRCLPSPVDCVDPLSTHSIAWWWQSPDVKIDAPTFVRSALDDVDFEVFEDDVTMFDRGIDFASGLRDDPTHPDRPVRVYVQVHNRGVRTARNVAVRVFFANAAVAPPDLPDRFWDRVFVDDGDFGPSWRAVGPARIVRTVDPGRSRVLGFDWMVPADSARQVTLCAVVSAANDPLYASARPLADAVAETKKIAVKNQVTVNPRVSVGPRVDAVALDVWRCGAARRFALGPDPAGRRMVHGIVFSRRLSHAACEGRLSRSIPQDWETEALERLVMANPALGRRLDLTTTYAPDSDMWVSGVELDRRRPEAVVLLIHPRPSRGYGSVVQYDDRGAVVGGFTIRARMHG